MRLINENMFQLKIRNENIKNYNKCIILQIHYYNGLQMPNYNVNKGL